MSEKKNPSPVKPQTPTPSRPEPAKHYDEKVGARPNFPKKPK